MPSARACSRPDRAERIPQDLSSPVPAPTPAAAAATANLPGRIDRSADLGPDRCEREFDTAQHFYKLGIMDEKSAVTALAALAQEARLRVFRALVGAGPAGMTPGALSAMLDIPASTLSFHLKELVHADLVSAEREGRHLHYRPALRQMDDLLAYLSAHCCMGQPCSPSGAKRQTTC